MLKADPSSSSLTASDQRLPGLDYLRGLAALAVTFYHSATSFSANSLVKAAVAPGAYGVDVFFVLSGFVIPWSVRSVTVWGYAQYKQFMLRRITRVETPYLASILLFIAVGIATNVATGHHDFQIDPTQLALHVIYLIPFSDYDWYLPVYWTLAYEFAFYIFVSLTFSTVIGNANPWPFRLVAAGMTAAVAFGALSQYFALFLMGCALFRLKDQKQDGLETAAIAIAAMAAMLPQGGLVNGVVGIVTLCFILFFSGLKAPGYVGSALGLLGTISFSLYLTQNIIGGRIAFQLNRTFDHGLAGELAASLVSVAVSLCVAYCFYLAIEKPAHAWARTIRISGHTS